MVFGGNNVNTEGRTLDLYLCSIRGQQLEHQWANVPCQQALQCVPYSSNETTPGDNFLLLSLCIVLEFVYLALWHGTHLSAENELLCSGVCCLKFPALFSTQAPVSRSPEDGFNWIPLGHSFGRQLNF